MAEPIDSIPWACGERGCEAGWHLATFWLDDDGTYTMDNYTDGDHEEIDSPPTLEEVAEAWIAYWRDVLETGEDPIGEVPGRQVHEVRAWQVRIANSIIGPVLHSVRPATKDRTVASGFHGRGPWRYDSEIPAEVANYLLFSHQSDHDRHWRVDDEYRSRVSENRYDRRGIKRYFDVVRDAARTGSDVTAPVSIVGHLSGGITFFVTISKREIAPPSKRILRLVARRSIREWKRSLALSAARESEPCIHCGAPIDANGDGHDPGCSYGPGTEVKV